MSWFKVDDKLPGHRKARAVRRSHPTKRRDVAPFGIWALAGAFSEDGFIPLEVLQDWDDDAETLAARLVAADMWHPTERDGEPGFVFHDWDDQNPAPSVSGAFGNHVRWHEKRGEYDPECDHCVSGRIAPESGAISGANRDPNPERIAPVPSRPDPTRPEKTPRAQRSDTDNRFDEFWNTYNHKVGRAKAVKAYAAALKKPDVTPDLLIAAAAAYIAWQTSEGKHPQYTKHPATWLNGEHWTDERVARAQPAGRAAQWLQLAADLGEPSNVRQIGDGR